MRICIDRRDRWKNGKKRLLKKKENEERRNW